MGRLPTSPAMAIVKWACSRAAASDGMESGLVPLHRVRAFAAATISNQSSTSSWDVGNPPSGSSPEEGKGDGRGGRREGEGDGEDANKRVDTKEVPSLKKETSTREMFHAKAKETEDRLSQQDKDRGNARSTDESK